MFASLHSSRSHLRIWNSQRSLQVLHLPHSSQVDKAEQQAYALVFDDLSVKVLPESTSKLAGDLPIHFWIQSGLHHSIKYCMLRRFQLHGRLHSHNASSNGLGAWYQSVVDLMPWEEDLSS